ncbi:MAG: acyl-CoA/acyl-ACP dehydrogenase [Alphaproteobacteria bacterium]|nr:acyl-CoA/acyl-ACP dehydrogenase [Alphaproteobacteria bacterium]
MSETDVSIPTGDDYPELRDAVTKLCADYPSEYWRKLEDQPPSSSYPTEFVEALTESGYLAALIPEEYGGSGLPIRAGAVILETVNAVGGSASACHAQMYTMGTILRHGSKAQKQEYLPKIASGELRLQAFAVTEPTTGSDTTQLKTRAVKDGDSYIVNGQKVWISRAAHSDLMLLLARTTPADAVKKRTDGISTFLVDMREAKGNGMEIRPIDAMVNHNTTEIFFDDLRIPASSLIGEEGKGFRYIIDGMNAERCLVSSEAIGNGRFFINKAVAYANERVVFGHPIGKNQGIQFPIAQAHAQLEAADLSVRKANAMFEAGLPCGAEANTAKFLSGEASWAAAEACFTTFGGFAFAREYDIERKWRECRLSRNAPVAPNMIMNFIGQHVLGMPRSY